jgi:malate synthase
MNERITVVGLQIAPALHDFIAQEALPRTGISAQTFWSGFASLVRDLGPRNRGLLARRDWLQEKIDDWHGDHRSQPFDQPGYESYLRDIEYLVPERADFTVRTTNVDDEIATIAGPQLVVPMSNARYALNAANARWGSLYDALYGTDAIPEDRGAARASSYNPVRGARVIARARMLLDMAVPLQQGSHCDSTSYMIADGTLIVRLKDGTHTPLARPEQFVGFRGEESLPAAILLCNHGLHIEIGVDRSNRVARDDPAAIADIILESAVTTIMDLEDSVAVVDADDKVVVYRNWLGLMNGTLTAGFDKNGRTIHRKLNSDRSYKSAAGAELRLHGRSLMFVRNVGHHMYTDAILDKGRRGDSRRHARCRGHFADCHARSARHRRHSQQSHQFDLHRQAQDAWARRSRLRG